MTEQHLLLASDAPEPAERNSAHPALERMSLSAGSPQEQARAVNQKAKRSNLLMTNRHFTLGKEIGVFGSHEFHVDVQCISNDKSSETVVIKQGTYVSLLQRAEPVRVFVAFTATNGTQARLFVRGDNEAGDPYPVSVLDVAEIVTDTPPGPQFWCTLACSQQIHRFAPQVRIGEAGATEGGAGCEKATEYAQP